MMWIAVVLLAASAALHVGEYPLIHSLNQNNNTELAPRGGLAFLKDGVGRDLADVNLCLFVPLFFFKESYGVHGRERLAHGRMLKIYLSKNCHSLVFEPAHDVGARNVYWVKGRTT